MRRLTGILAIAVAIGVVGCAGTPTQAPYNRAAHPQIKTIGILTPAVPEDFQVRVVNPAEGNFPLLGDLVGAIVRDVKGDHFSEAVAKQGFVHSKEAAEALARGVHDAGYEVLGVRAKREWGEFLDKDKYPNVSQVDALLDSYVTYAGYFAAGSTTPYRPTYFLGVRLVDARTKAILFADELIYNPIGDTKDAVTIQADPVYQYDSYDTLMNHVPEAVEGLRAALRALGGQVGNELQ